MVNSPAGPNPLHLIPSGAHDRRRVFVIPWGRQVVVGTTDDLYEGSLDEPSVSRDDADYLCAAVNEAFGLELGPHDAVGAWAGLRPLPRAGAEPGGRSDVLSRRHALLTERRATPR